MALSTLLRRSLCMNGALGSQTLRLATRPAPVVRLLTQNSGASSPLFNAVRAVRTLPVPNQPPKGDHSKIWLVEKLVSVLLIPLVPAALAYPNKTLDSILAVAMVAHIFWGFEAIAVDYVRPILFGPVVPKLAVGAVYLLCFATLGGLFYNIQHDIGIANTFRQLWAIHGKN